MRSRLAPETTWNQNLVDRNSLKDLLHTQGLSRSDKLILCLGVDPDRPKAVRDIKQIARSAGLRAAERWNVSGLLSRSGPRAVRTDEGWELNKAGRDYIAAIAPTTKPKTPPATSAALRKHLLRIRDENTRDFVEQSVRCFEERLYRAAVVLSWVGAVSVLYHYVVKNKLAEFNKEAARRNPKWKAARNADDLARMKEREFLDVLDKISVIGKSVKQELDGCLIFRNGCGHPNSLRIGENRVASHLETLTQNVFGRF